MKPIVVFIFLLFIIHHTFGQKSYSLSDSLKTTVFQLSCDNIKSIGSDEKIISYRSKLNGKEIVYLDIKDNFLNDFDSSSVLFIGFLKKAYVALKVEKLNNSFFLILPEKLKYIYYLDPTCYRRVKVSKIPKNA
jgi:hypothetical protein